MTSISCSSSPKRLAGSKKEFPNVSARVNSFKERPTGSSADGESPAKLIDQPRQRTHHDSSSVAGCLKGTISKPKSKIPERKPVVTCRKATPATAAPEWNITTRVDYKAEVKPLPGTKKTLVDFVRKPFRATSVPPSTYKPPKDLPTGKQLAKKNIVKMTPEPVINFRANPVPASTYKQPKDLAARKQSPQHVAKKDTAIKPAETFPPFRAKPVPASTYKPFQPAKILKPVNDNKKV